jgi:hypothetical protein
MALLLHFTSHSPPIMTKRPAEDTLDNLAKKPKTEDGFLLFPYPDRVRETIKKLDKDTLSLVYSYAYPHCDGCDDIRDLSDFEDSMKLTFNDPGEIDWMEWFCSSLCISKNLKREGTAMCTCGELLKCTDCDTIICRNMTCDEKLVCLACNPPEELDCGTCGTTLTCSNCDECEECAKLEEKLEDIRGMLR